MCLNRIPAPGSGEIHASVFHCTLPKSQILGLVKFMPVCLTQPQQNTRSWIRWNSCQCVWLCLNKIPDPGSGEIHASVFDCTLPKYQILDLVKFMPMCLTEPEQNTRSWIWWNSCQCVWLSLNKIPDPGSGEIQASMFDFTLPQYQLLDLVKYMPVCLTEHYPDTWSLIWWNSC